MRFATIFNGGHENSAAPRKVHLVNTATHMPLCGQTLPRWERAEYSDIEPDNFLGREACSKCQKQKAKALTGRSRGGIQWLSK